MSQDKYEGRKIVSSHKRIIICSTVEHAIIVAAALQAPRCRNDLDNIILITNFWPHMTNLVSTMKETFQSLLPAATVQYFNDHGPVKIRQPEDALLISQTLKDIAEAEVEEVWCWTLYNRFEQVAYETFPDAAWVLYEDGLSPYKSYPVYSQELTGRTPQDRIVELLGGSGVLHEHINRVSTCYLLIHELVGVFGPQIPVTKIQPISPAAYRQCKMKLSESLASSSCTVDQAGGLMIGSCFSSIGALTYEEELGICIRAAEKLIETHGLVYWREAPNIEKKLGGQMKAHLPNHQFVILEHTVVPGTVEMMVGVDYRKFSCVASLLSSTLFKIHLLHNLPFYLFGGEHEQKIWDWYPGTEEIFRCVARI